MIYLLVIWLPVMSDNLNSYSMVTVAKYNTQTECELAANAIDETTKCIPVKLKQWVSLPL